ncbi:MAG: MBL fold metallo-hydrolase [Eubacteriales bacterium]|nr:MBL fold metallo-hydrolase [Eubacteriales bacterium]
MRLIPLFSGSSGNCILLEAGGARLLVDAGLPGRTIEAALSSVGVSPQTLTGILVTHEHIDHTRGIGVLSRRFDLPVYANAGTWEGMQADVGPVALRNMRMFETGREFYADKLLIQSFPTPHDARESVGYSFAAEDRRASVMTDIGYVPEALLDAVGKSDLLLIESNHDEEMLKVGPYPYPLKRRILGDQGHLSNENCGKTLCKLYKRGVRCAILGHLSKENNYEQLALETVRSELRCEDIPDDAFQLTVAHRDRITGVFVL